MENLPRCEGGTLPSLGSQTLDKGVLRGFPLHQLPTTKNINQQLQQQQLGNPTSIDLQATRKGVPAQRQILLRGQRCSAGAKSASRVMKSAQQISRERQTQTVHPRLGHTRCCAASLSPLMSLQTGGLVVGLAAILLARKRLRDDRLLHIAPSEVVVYEQQNREADLALIGAKMVDVLEGVMLRKEKAQVHLKVCPAFMNI